MGITSKLNPLRWFGIQVKGLEQNRAELPTGGLMGSGGYDYYSELLAAIRGVNVRRPKLDVVREAGDVRLNSIVSLCINWIATSWPEAPVTLGKRKGAHIEPTEEEHMVLRLLRNPNPMYRGKWLSWALQSDWWSTGNAYCHIVTDGVDNLHGQPAELEWLPVRYMEPIADKNTGRLSHYEYSPKGYPRIMEPKEVVHFRFGIDPNNPLKGVSPLLAQAAYIVADNGAGLYGAGMMHYGGLPPAILVPDMGGATPNPLARNLKPEEATDLADDLHEKLQTEPGKIRFIGNGVKLLTLGYKPNEMNLNDLMEQPETRIPAAFGIPPEVIKVRVGLSHSTENNIKESRKAAWQDCLAPTQDIYAEDWSECLLKRFPNVEGNRVIHYDRRHVGVLQPDMSALRTDAATLYNAGIIDRYEAKVLSGHKPADEDKGVYKTAAPADPNNPQADPKKPEPPKK